MSTSRRSPIVEGRGQRSPWSAAAVWVFAGVLALLAGGLASSVRLGAQAPVAVAGGYDLAADEAVGGHTLERHVGRTDAQLAERLRREPRISAASTYTDEATARRVVALALEANRERVDGWARRRGPRPNLVVSYVVRAGPAIGRTLHRGERTARPSLRALVVLRWRERLRRWYVLTSYPENR